MLRRAPKRGMTFGCLYEMAWCVCVCVFCDFYGLLDLEMIGKWYIKSEKRKREKQKRDKATPHYRGGLIFLSSRQNFQFVVSCLADDDF